MPGQALVMFVTRSQGTSRELGDHGHFKSQRWGQTRGKTGEKVECFGQTYHPSEVTAESVERAGLTAGSLKGQTHVLQPLEMIDRLAQPFVTVVPLEVVVEEREFRVSHDYFDLAKRAGESSSISWKASDQGHSPVLKTQRREKVFFPPPFSTFPHLP